MPHPRYRISTRQKADRLYSVANADLQGATFPLESDLRRVSGYSAVSILAIANVPFTVVVEEGCEKEGVAPVTQMLASSVDATTGLNVVCTRFAPCGTFAKFFLDFGVATPTAVSACFLGLPESATPGVAGPAGPPGPPGPPGDQIVAADIVVDPAGVRSDVTTLAAAIAALPAGGGSIFLHAGTYSLAASVVMPGVPVTIMGSGRGNTIIDIASNVIAAFTLGSDVEYAFYDMTVRGDGMTAGQIAFLATAGMLGSFPTVFERVDIDAVDLNVSAAGGSFMEARVSDSIWDTSGLASSRTWSGSGVFRAYYCRLQGGGFSGSPIVDLTSCDAVQLDNAGVVESIVAVDSDFRISGANAITVGSSFCRLTACTFVGVVAPRGIDITAASLFGSIRGCRFSGFSSEEVRLAASSYTISSNIACRVLETGAADSNRYSNNIGFAGSTIIGPNSVVEGWKRKDVTGGATVDALTSQFIHHNEKALGGSGTIKNTGGSLLTLRRSATDAFGVSATADSIVIAGGSLSWALDVAVGAAVPPFVTFEILVRSTVPGMSTTFSLRHASVGAE